MPMDEERLSAVIKSGNLPHMWLLYGEENYLSAFYADKLTALTVDGALKVFNFHVYEGDDADLGEILETAQLLPAMSEKRCILIKDLPFHQMNKADAAAFLEALADVPDTTVLILLYTKLVFSAKNKEDSKWLPLIRRFEELGAAAELTRRTPAKTRQMLIRGAKSRGTSISPELADELVSVVGDDITNLLNEFNKLCAYADGQPITKEMIDAVAVKSVTASVFDVSAAILGGNTQRAFDLVKELLRQKTPVQPIIGALGLTYVNLYRCMTAKAEGYTPDSFADAFGYKGNYNYTFSKLAPFARRCTLPQIRRSVEILTDADVKSKSSAVDPETLLTGLLATLAGALE